MRQDDADQIKDGLTQKLEMVLKEFWPGWVQRGQIAYPIPGKAKGDLGSFNVYLSSKGKYPRGGWVRSSKGVGGDVINLFAYGLSGDTNHHANADTFREARNFLGMRNESDEEKEERARRAAEYSLKRAAEDRAAAARQEEQERRKTASALGLLKMSQPIMGTLAEAYLVEARGIPRPPCGWPDSELRFVERAEYEFAGEGPRPTYPALLGRIRNCEGETTAVWRIFLDGNLNPAFKGRISSFPSKAGLGPSVGGAVRLGGIGPRIGLAEGIESALASWALVNFRYPVWAGLSATFIEKFDLPTGVERVDGFPDGDLYKMKNGKLIEPRGEQAFNCFGSRCQMAGVRFVMQPSMWNGDSVDLIKQVGALSWREAQGTTNL